jgi:glycosyltransferase involved in cell wall biosynthesis
LSSSLFAEEKSQDVSSETCVVIPAFQAESTIGPVVASVRRFGLSVIVVDDASTDATAAKAKQAGARVITRSANGGKGASLRQGLEEALKGKSNWFLTMDADGQHLAEEIPLFLRAAAAGGADMIVGNRMGKPNGMPPIRIATNRTMSWFLSRMTRQYVPDTQCGFRIVSRPALEKIELSSDRFEIDSEFVVKAAWAGFRIRSIPVSSVYRREPSFIRPFRDTLRFFRFIRSLKPPPP